jgi:transcriptional regulator with XRE-family HTH domain
MGVKIMAQEQKITFPAFPTEPRAEDNFAARLKEVRERRQWTQIELGIRSGMPGTSIAHMESGTRKPSFETLRRLATALEVTTDYLLGRVDDPVTIEGADVLFRDFGKLTGADQKLARDFVTLLAARNKR